ncbi:MAG: ABC transporter substrate-binding protein [Candidatus Eremiobacteraeota bacterium]|nr:ABC transporter substrate-binding protein [Candidatus Eremiobacteraeota bacterium]MBV8356129.1 ABC transporter substrate-binding protein [Candidatus Eremiobacteraeota bacterium]
MSGMLALAFTCVSVAPARAETTELRISQQPGLQYLSTLVIQQNFLIEKHAKALGIPNLKVKWITLTSGGIAMDSLLSGNLDMVTSGISNLLVGWSATGGQVKGLAAVGAMPQYVVSKDPNVHTLKDFTSADKIAVPTVRVSMQSTMLAMAADKIYGDSDIHHFDPMTVALGHPDAFIALQSGGGSINAHFGSPPYQDEEIKLPGVHLVANSYDIVGGPHSVTCVFTTTKFHDENPKVIRAFYAAMQEADELIRTNHRTAAQIYLQQSHEKWPLDLILKELDNKQYIFQEAPLRSMAFADIMYKGGTIKTKANSWKDFFFQEVWNQKGS